MTFTCFVFFDMFNALSSRSQVRLSDCSWLIQLGRVLSVKWARFLALLAFVALVTGPDIAFLQTCVLTGMGDLGR